MEEQCSPPWGPVTKVVVVLVILVALGVVFYSFSEAFPPLVIALLIAYVLTPIVNAVSARTRLPRVLSTLLIYLAFAVTAGVAVGLLTPPLVRRMTAFQLDLAEVVAAVETLLNRQYSVGEFSLDLSQFYAELQGELARLVRPAVGQTLALGNPVRIESHDSPNAVTAAGDKVVFERISPGQTISLTAVYLETFLPSIMKTN